jgi:hypothetical protein
VETQKAIEQQILTLLLGDTTLTTTMGNSNIRVGTGLRSDAFPYIRFDIQSSIKEFGAPITMRGPLTVDLWDKNETSSERISDMLERVIELLDFKTFANQEEFLGVRIYYDSNVTVDDSSEFVYHKVALFTVEYIRTNIINV